VTDETIIICRCEDITLADLHSAFEEGITDFEELKRVLRCTMGPCQGRTCRELILREISKFRNVEPDDIEVPVYRPPTTPVTLAELAEAYKQDQGGDDNE